MKNELIKTFCYVRQQTERLCNTLNIEDYGIQGMDDVSPPKWHLAHTTWFFETFILKKHATDYKAFDPCFHYLFNSYYHAMGHPYPRMKRGLLSRPLVSSIYNYRKHVDTHLINLLETASSKQFSELQSLIILGLEHEQQHQELLLTDVKYNFSLNADFPVYHNSPAEISSSKSASNLEFMAVEGGIINIGYEGVDFCFDNELPSHQAMLGPYSIANRLINNEEYLNFISDGGYEKSTLWLADGWDWLTLNKINSPLYWHFFDNQWMEFTLNGLKALNPVEPVSHISFFEADAFARWQGMRLPSEEEWEHCVKHLKLDASDGNFMETERYHPQPSQLNNSAQGYQFWGDLWEWTSSNYNPYPGYKAFKGELGEYNGKFMNNQRVLRGGSCVTPLKHMRTSYRNFFQPDKRWQFCGIRLAQDN